jgi:hypothetical protein
VESRYGQTRSYPQHHGCVLSMAGHLVKHYVTPTRGASRDSLVVFCT